MRFTHSIEATGAALAMLRRTNVLSDVFRIWFDGPFGTISGLRLGRTASSNVSWEEINAAWGQAVLLLATLAKVGGPRGGERGGGPRQGARARSCVVGRALGRHPPPPAAREQSNPPPRPAPARHQACGMQFSQWRLLPMGSYPRVADVRGTYDLFGPVSKFLCASYDRAQAGYLACLAEFAAWLRARGASDGGGNPFQLPWAIEGDKVGGHALKLLFNKDKSWTRALKYMLVDLKFCLK